MQKQANLMKEERQALLLETLRQEGKLLAAEWSERLNISEDTVRRDVLAGPACYWKVGFAGERRRQDWPNRFLAIRNTCFAGTDYSVRELIPVAYADAENADAPDWELSGDQISLTVSPTSEPRPAAGDDAPAAADAPARRITEDRRRK